MTVQLYCARAIRREWRTNRPADRSKHVGLVRAWPRGDSWYCGGCGAKVRVVTP